MNYQFYENCRQFLERMIQEDKSNKDLINAYSKLIEKYADLEASAYEQNTSFSKDFNKNQADLAKNLQTQQAEITKKQIDKGMPPVMGGYPPAIGS